MPVDPALQRLQLLTGTPALEALGRCHVAIFGIGGVGSWAAEALARSGVGRLTLVDGDVVCATNLNRQLQATAGNVGRPKVEELKARLATVSPRCRVAVVPEFYEPATADRFDLAGFDFVLDCIDSIACKVDLITRAVAAGATLYASMGAAARLDPTLVRVGSIWETRGCPLARVIRRRLRERGFAGDFRAVFSPEAVPPAAEARETGRGDGSAARRTVNGSAVHVTATFGMVLAGLVIQDVAAAHPAPPPPGCESA